MAENEAPPGDEKLLILPLGEESKKITQVISNDMARKILDLLADAPLSASDIAERLATPLTTIVYNLENLESVGLIKVERIKYSEKGREVRIYAPVRKLIVIVPEKIDRKSITDILRKYVGVVLAAVLASSIIEFLLFRAGAPPWELTAYSYDMKSATDSLNISAAPEAVNESLNRGMMAIEEMNQTSAVSVQSTAAAAPAPVQTTLVHEVGAVKGGAPDMLASIADTVTSHPGLLFLLGCIFVVVLLVVWDVRKKRKNG
ncbi:MAG: helix-turn-helix domain-containing protein [Euryarchaeota archaeon]|nr:helix-turn-helix domain-containing protein [Euryarchaeota archaeon]MCG2735698.1 helix-turn-helix domain-containing protein [Candidatus Methanoperedenaceae archaeon]